MGRRHAMAQIHALYNRLSNDWTCVYCGDRATSWDHFVPVSVACLFAGSHFEVKGRFLLPACGDCNRRASDKIFRTVAAKRRYIQTSLREAHASLLRSPDWSERELRQLEWTLRTAILAHQARKRRVLARLTWRNTLNPASAEIAKVHSNLGGSGSISAQWRAGTNGTRIKPAKPASSIAITSLKPHCPGCGQAFTPRFPKQEYCSSDCLPGALG